MTKSALIVSHKSADYRILTAGNEILPAKLVFARRVASHVHTALILLNRTFALWTRL